MALDLFTSYNETLGRIQLSFFDSVTGDPINLGFSTILDAAGDFTAQTLTRVLNFDKAWMRRASFDPSVLEIFGVNIATSPTSQTRNITWAEGDPGLVDYTGNVLTSFSKSLSGSSSANPCIPLEATYSTTALTLTVRFNNDLGPNADGLGAGTAWEGVFNDQRFVFSGEGNRLVSNPKVYVFTNVQLGEGVSDDDYISYNGTNGSFGFRGADGVNVPAFTGVVVSANGNSQLVCTGAEFNAVGPELSVTFNGLLDPAYVAVEDAARFVVNYGGNSFVPTDVAIVDNVATFTLTSETPLTYAGPDRLTYLGGESSFKALDGKVIVPFGKDITLAS